VTSAIRTCTLSHMSAEPQKSPSYLVWSLVLLVCVGGLVLWTQRARFLPGAETLVSESKVLKLYGEPRQTSPDPETEPGRVQMGRIQLQLPEQRMVQVIDGSDPRVSRTADGLMLTDVRDGWLVAHRTQFEVDLPSDVTGTLRVDVGLLYSGELDKLGLTIPAGLGMKFSVGLVDEDGVPRPLTGMKLVANADSVAWNPLSCPLSTLDMKSPKLVFQSLLEDVEPDQLTMDLVRNIVACWANPMLVREKVDPAKVPNVIVLTIDTLRADHLGCYGYERDTSPNIDALVARGALFENVTSGSPWTLPSYGSLFTGRFPAAHRAGVRPRLDVMWGTPDNAEPLEVSSMPSARQTRQLAPKLVTLAEALRDQGYRTAGLFNNPFLHPTRGIDQGFERYAWYQYTANDGVDEALEWIEEQHGAPFFLFLHLMDPHIPYAPPPPFDEKFSGQKLADVADYPWTLGDLRARPNPEAYKDILIDMYDGEIAYTDAQIGRFVQALESRGLMDETIVVVHSDHGEEFWEHGGFEHGHSLHRELLQVPLAIVYPPKIPAGTRVPARVRTVDVFPTVLDLLGLEPEVAELQKGRLTGDGATLNARSLVPWIEGARSDDLDTFSEAMLYGPPDGAFWEQKARCEGDLKIIIGGQQPTDLLFDLKEDPGETQNVLMDNWEAARDMRKRMTDAYLVLSKESNPSGTSKPTQLEIEQMKALGYAGDGEEGGDEAEEPKAGDGQ
jgi:arylsulfatase A-like enzyme